MVARDARLKDGDGNVLTDGDGVPLYDGGPFEIDVHDCGDADDRGPGQILGGNNE
jgi:hypothetical protein